MKDLIADGEFYRIVLGTFGGIFVAVAEAAYSW